MQMHRNAVIAGTILLAFSSVFVTSEGATARPRGHIEGRGHIDGRRIVCGGGSIPVRVYAANHYYARPSVCGGGPVNANMEPDFQLVRTR
jgi:hypothetical protein